MRLFLLVAAFTAVSSNATAADCTATSTGSWAVAGTWSGCGGSTPGSSDTAIIAANKVTLAASVTVGGLTVTGGELALAGQKLTVATSGTLSAGQITGTGTVGVSGSMSLSGGNVGTSLTSPGINVGVGAHLTMANNAYAYGPVTNHGTIEGRGGFLSGTITNPSDGTIHVPAGYAYAVGALTSSGTITIEGQLDTAGYPFVQNAGSTTLIGGGRLLGLGGLTFHGGTLSGNGSLEGPVTVDGGTINVGTGVGTIAVVQPPAGQFSANYTQTGGTLHVELGGLYPGQEYDRLIVLGTSTIGGSATLQVDFVGGFTPVAGDGFDVITAASGHVGSFGTVNGTLSTTYGAHAVTLGAQASRADYRQGDLFVTHPWGVSRFTKAGDLVELIATGVETDSTAQASCIDATGSFYRVRWSGSVIEKYDAHGTLIDASWSVDRFTSCAVSSSGKFVAFGASGITQLDTAGNTTNTFAAVGDSGAFVANNCTVAYIALGQLKAYDVCTNAPDTRFDGFTPDNSEVCSAVAVHPNGDVFTYCWKSGTYNGTLYRLRNNAIAQRYLHSTLGVADFLASEALGLAVDPSGTAVWLARAGVGWAQVTILKIDIASGTILQQIEPPFGVVRGLALFGAGATAPGPSGSTGSVTPPMPPAPMDTTPITAPMPTEGPTNPGTEGDVMPPETTKKSGCNGTGSASSWTLALVALCIARVRRERFLQTRETTS